MGRSGEQPPCITRCAVQAGLQAELRHVTAERDALAAQVSRHQVGARDGLSQGPGSSRLHYTEHFVPTDYSCLAMSLTPMQHVAGRGRSLLSATCAALLCSPPSQREMAALFQRKVERDAAVQSAVRRAEALQEQLAALHRVRGPGPPLSLYAPYSCRVAEVNIEKAPTCVEGRTTERGLNRGAAKGHTPIPTPAHTHPGCRSRLLPRAGPRAWPHACWPSSAAAPGWRGSWPTSVPPAAGRRKRCRGDGAG